MAFIIFVLLLLFVEFLGIGHLSTRTVHSSGRSFSIQSVSRETSRIHPDSSATFVTRLTLDTVFTRRDTTVRSIAVDSSYEIIETIDDAGDGDDIEFATVVNVSDVD